MRCTWGMPLHCLQQSACEDSCTRGGACAHHVLRVCGCPARLGVFNYGTPRRRTERRGSSFTHSPCTWYRTGMPFGHLIHSIHLVPDKPFSHKLLGMARGHTSSSMYFLLRSNNYTAAACLKSRRVRTYLVAHTVQRAYYNHRPLCGFC